MSMFTLTTNKIRAIADVSKDIAQVFFASVLIEPIISSHTNFIIIFVGAIFSGFGFVVHIVLSDVSVTS